MKIDQDVYREIFLEAGRKLFPRYNKDDESLGSKTYNHFIRGMKNRNPFKRLFGIYERFEDEEEIRERIKEILPIDNDASCDMLYEVSRKGLSLEDALPGFPFEVFGVIEKTNKKGEKFYRGKRWKPESVWNAWA
ncbi:hypothetical protein KAT24_01320 [Candidatus Pacearchaeota archaeon]|nr:hypothetical protein [Candidatus Pacearchaeota archaeon]